MGLFFPLIPRKLSLALYITSKTSVSNNWILQIFAKDMLIFKFSPKNIRIGNFDVYFSFFVCLLVCLFLANYESYEYYKIHRKFRVHIARIFLD